MNAIDLNLLRVFQAVFLERNVTRAAARLGLTQPAMSNALRRLREMLNDPLFVRPSREMLPTPRALEIAPRVDEALKAVGGILVKFPFDPRKSTARFSIAATDYVEFVCLASVHPRILAEAPGMALAVRRIRTLFEPPADDLTSGVLDFAIGPFPLPPTPQSGLHSLPLFRDRWVCLARKAHPTVKRRLTLNHFVSLKHIPISYPSTPGPGMVDRLLADHGLKRTAATTVAHFITVPFYVANSDCIAVVPARLARFFAGFLPLRIFPLPFAVPPLQVSLIWHARTHSEPAHVWLRKLIGDTAPSTGRRG
jgi:DNA-binding transcriptional LysR family regulator